MGPRYSASGPWSLKACSVAARSACTSRSPGRMALPSRRKIADAAGSRASAAVAVPITAMSPAVTGKPSRARRMAGAISAARGRVPYRTRASSSPAALPGTPTASQLSRDKRGTTSPLASRNMPAVAASGAFSRKSRNAVRPSASRTVMNPPPPRLPAAG